MARSGRVDAELAQCKIRRGSEKTRGGEDPARRAAIRTEKDRAKYAVRVTTGRDPSTNGSNGVCWYRWRQRREHERRVGSTLHGTNQSRAAKGSAGPATAAAATAAAAATTTTATATTGADPSAACN